MTGRTLEEIEALAADATPGPWAMNTDPPYDSVVGSDGRTVCCDTAYYPTAVSIEDMRLIAALPDLLAIAQGQREEIKRLRKNHLFRMLQVVLYRYRAGLCKRSQTDKVDRFADRIRDALTV